MDSEFSSCPVCKEDYDLDQRLPKSLDCRHSVCQICLVGNGHPLECCPLCPQTVSNPERAVNDLTMMAYLTQTSEQAKMKCKLRSLHASVEQEHERAQQSLNEFTANDSKTMNDTRNRFHKQSRRLVHQSLDHCNSGVLFSEISAKAREELEARLEDARSSCSAIKSLLAKSHIDRNDFEMCLQKLTQTQALQDETNPDNLMWRRYREKLQSHFNTTLVDANTCGQRDGKFTAFYV